MGWTENGFFASASFPLFYFMREEEEGKGDFD
jgi:hypothetical protein